MLEAAGLEDVDDVTLEEFEVMWKIRNEGGKRMSIVSVSYFAMNWRCGGGEGGGLLFFSCLLEFYDF
jgi:hypothetical protein